MSDTCGIYKIENLINHQVYIGQSININKRWREHKSAAFNSNSKDYNMVIYKAIRKFGLKNFSFTVLEECSLEDLNKKEIQWIKYYDSYYHGYNATLGGDTNHFDFGQPIELYNLKGQFIIEYPSITVAAKAIGVSRNTIYGIIYGNRLSTKGYQFKLKNDTKTIVKPYANKQGGKKSVIQYIDNGTIINEFESATEAGRKLSLDPSSITKCCKNKLKHVGGYCWRYKE